MNSTSQFYWGVLGSIALEIIRLYKPVIIDRKPLPDLTLSYGLLVLGMVIVGGALSVALESNKKLQAFYTGLTCPMVLSAIIA